MYKKTVKYFTKKALHLKFTLMFRSFGKGSYVKNPLSIQGSKNISIGSKTNIGYKAWLGALPLTHAQSCQLKIGNNCAIGNFNHIFATQSVIIEDNVLTADKVYISDNSHSFEDVNMPIKQQPIKQINNVVIGNGAWLGENVCIIGASVGRNSVVGANSVVTKDIPDYCVAVGAPAKIIKRYNTKTASWEKTNPDGSYII